MSYPPRPPNYTPTPSSLLGKRKTPTPSSPGVNGVKAEPGVAQSQNGGMRVKTEEGNGEVKRQKGTSIVFLSVSIVGNQIVVQSAGSTPTASAQGADSNSGT